MGTDHRHGLMSVIVIGNAVTDRSFRVDRLPRPGETMVARDSRVDCGGKGFNQAVCATRAGASVMLQTSVGDDAAGRAILTALKEECIALPKDPFRLGPTDEAVVLVLPDGENAIVCSTHAATHSDHRPGLAAMRQFAGGGWLVCQGNLERATTAETLACARNNNLHTLVNPSPHLFDYAGLWPLIDVVIINLPESKSLTGLDDCDQAAALLLESGCRTIVVTTGQEGARLYRAGHAAAFIVPAPVADVDVIDTTGAGDTCCGVLVAGLDQGLDIEVALAWGVRAAAITVSRWGSLTALPSRAQLASLRG